MKASRGTLEYHTVVTTDGVELTEENIGRMIDMTMVMKNWATGHHHLTHKITAKYIGNSFELGPDCNYAMFIDAVKNGEHLGDFGTPLAFFR